MSDADVKVPRKRPPGPGRGHKTKIGNGTSIHGGAKGAQPVKLAASQLTGYAYPWGVDPETGKRKLNPASQEARDAAHEALALHVEMMRDESDPNRAFLAREAVLNRVLGKPKQTVDGNLNLSLLDLVRESMEKPVELPVELPPGD